MLCVRAWTVRVSVDFGRLVSFVFHWWWIDCSFLRLRLVLPWSIVGLPLTAPFSPILLDASPFHQICRVQKHRKKCVRAAETPKKQVSHTGSAYLTIQVIPHRLYSFSIQPKLLTLQIFRTVTHPNKRSTRVSAYAINCAQILRKTIAKHHVAAGTNDLSPNNEKRAIPAQQPD